MVSVTRVLIVPFMELKQVNASFLPYCVGLNRTIKTLG